jgi:hypothetical protein
LAAVIADATALDAGARARMAEVARTNVLKRFTVDQMRAATIDVYQQVLGTA